MCQRPPPLWRERFYFTQMVSITSLSNHLSSLSKKCTLLCLVLCFSEEGFLLIQVLHVASPVLCHPPVTKVFGIFVEYTASPLVFVTLALEEPGFTAVFRCCLQSLLWSSTGLKSSPQPVLLSVCVSFLFTCKGVVKPPSSCHD